MNFIDKARISIFAGKGGDGCVSFRREKYVPKGGPDGGNGGKGGDVFFIGDSSINSLLQFHYRQKFKAKNGKPGSGSNKTGSNGEDLVIHVPLGTQVSLEKIDENTQEKSIEYIGEILEDKELILIAKGGLPGKGNASFVSSTRQSPDFATEGKEGETFNVRLELKLLADVGLIGYPNAGKSTLLSRLTKANPKVGAYPFTTLIPNLGVLFSGYDNDIVIADIPGLIEGASSGKGMGLDFLRHIERTLLLLFLLDPSQDSIKKQYELLKKELSSFNEEIANRTHLLILTKSDIKSEFERNCDIVCNLSVSGITGENIDKLILLIIGEVQKMREKEKEVE
ncbi:MAG: GTPase ObgE [Candidatus Coatesbacteria bacterium]|nr:GTPase ObgE [Candidatus Coatesbacteria bacterium]